MKCSFWRNLRTTQSYTQIGLPRTSTVGGNQTLQVAEYDSSVNQMEGSVGMEITAGQGSRKIPSIHNSLGSAAR